MKKRIVFIALVLMLLVGCAQAQSILPSVEKTNVEPVVSFGVTVDAKPVSTQKNALAGTFTEVYEEVDEDQYNAFGERLGEEGYTLLAQETAGNAMKLTVGNGKVTIALVYDPAQGRLEVVYPAGVTLERALPAALRGYQVINYGEEIKIPGHGSFTLKKLNLGKPTPLVYSQILVGNMNFGMKVSNYLVGTFTNTGTRAKGCNQVLSFRLYYITDENVYTYDDWFTGMHQKDAVYIGSYGGSSGGVDFNIDPNWPFSRYTQPRIGSLDSGEFAAVFSDVPDAVQNATEGMLAVTVSYGDHRYVIIDRY